MSFDPRAVRIGSALLALCGGLTARAADDPYAWVAPPAEVQVLSDTGGVPVGMGALFVPSLAPAEDEPEVLIVDGDRVLRGPTGERIVLPPGGYVVLVGTGDPDQRVGVQVVVREGRTTTVPVRWGGLRVESVSKRLKARPDSYELVRVDTDARVELPPELALGGDIPKTWLLAPGLYRLQEKGADGVDSPVFTTVHVPEGGLVHQRLFVDRTGAILGGGVVAASAWTDHDVEESPFTRALVVGLDGSGSQTQNVAGFPDLTVADASAFVDLDLGYKDKRSAVVFGLDATLGMMLLQPATGEPLPLIKSRDRLAALASYTLRLNEGAGLYVRGGGETQMTDTNAIAAEDSEIAFRELNGSVRYRNVAAPDTYRVADAFQPLLLQAGTGLEVRLSTFDDLDLNLRGGLGYRHLNYEGTYVPTDNPDTPAIEYTAIGNMSEPGVEAGASAALRITGFANWTTSLDAFTAFDGTGGISAAWDNTLSVRITRAVSLNYALNAARIPWVTERIALRQGAYVRFALDVL